MRHDDPRPFGVNVIDGAPRVGLSSSRLSRLFKRQMGVSLSRFRNQQRLRRFVALYRSGQRVTMLDAALAAGFGSYAQFHRVFKELMGVNPQSYRRSTGRLGP